LILFTPLVFALLTLPYFILPLQITLNISPYPISQDLVLKIDPTAANFDLAAKILPVKELVEESTATVTIKTTGTKLVGEKAKGEIIVYNNQDKAQTLPKGAKLTDAKGHKFETTAAAQIAPASYDLDKGVINMGQTKILAQAAEIGTDYNIPEASKLQFTDSTAALLLAKSNQNFTGGSSQTVATVSQEDKANLQKALNEKIKQQTEEKYQGTINNASGLLKGTVRTDNGKIEFNREVGEEAGELTATSRSKVTAYLLNNDTKKQVIEASLTSLPDNSKLDIEHGSYDLSVESADLSQAKVKITGKVLPKIDEAKLVKNLTFRTKTKVVESLKTSVPNLYDSSFSTYSPYYKLFNLTPPLPALIKLKISE
jgi:hypothetical protein